MRVLIVKMSALGDVIHALPVIDYLRQSVRGIEIDWVVEESFSDLLTGNPDLALLHTVRFKSWRKSPFSPATWGDIRRVTRALSERAYDIVFDLQGNIKSGIVAWLAGGRRRFGFDQDGVREALNVYFTTHQVPLRPQDHHITDRSLRLVSVPFGRDYAGMELQGQIHTLAEDDEAAALFLATLSDGLVFLMHHGTTWQTKLWHEEGWIEAGRGLLAAFPDATLLLSWGGEAEQKAAERIAAAVGPRARLLPRLTLKGFTAMIKKVDLVIGGDTGPVHLAAAVGTPTVSLFRATDGTRNAPRGPIHGLIQSPMPCAGCLKKACDRDDACRRSITAAMVLEKCQELLCEGGP